MNIMDLLNGKTLKPTEKRRGVIGLLSTKEISVAEFSTFTFEAFQTVNFPGQRRMDEHYLIHLLRDTDYPIPEPSFVAELGNPSICVAENGEM